MFMKPFPSLLLALLFLNVQRAMLAGAVVAGAGPAGVAGAASPAGVAGAAGPAGVGGAAGSAATTATATATGGQETILEMYIHDILGGSVPTARPVTGLLGNIYSSQVPFAKPIGFLPPDGAVALPNANGANPTVNGLNGLPLGTGLSGTAFAGNANPQNVPTQLGADGLGLGFGTITVIDDILTTTPDLGSQALGKAQGVYVASSADGSKQLMAFTALLEGGEYNDNLNFFGVYTIGGTISQLSVTGGTGKFKNAYGIAEVRPLIPPGQHATDGAETLLRITVHLKY